MGDSLRRLEHACRTVLLRTLMFSVALYPDRGGGVARHGKSQICKRSSVRISVNLGRESHEDEMRVIMKNQLFGHLNSDFSIMKEYCRIV